MPIRYRHAPVTLMDRVSSVCDAGDMDVFDLSVSGEPVFSASGFAAHNCEDECFKATGARVFPEQIVAAQNAYVKPPLNRGDIERVNNQPVFMPQESGSLRIWDFPKKGHLYVIGADASGGVTDNASAQVIDRTTWKQVATLSGLITADVFGERLFNLGALYNWAEVIPESNNHGLATVLKLRDMGYPNIGRRDKMIITDEGREEEEELGWNTNSKTKPVIIMGLYQALRENLIQVQEQETVDEIRHYYVLDRSKTGYTTYGAGPGFHDDRVMSLAIALKYAQELPDQSPQQTPARPGRETVGITGY